MALPEPSEGHRKLEAFAGAWSGEDRMHPSPWDPKGGLAEGRTTSRVGLGGFALISDYEQTRDGRVTYAGHGVLTYDPRADRYEQHWFDSMGAPPQVFTGGFEGDALTLTHGGPGMHARITYDASRPGELRKLMEVSPDGARWSTLFESRYRRA